MKKARCKNISKLSLIILLMFAVTATRAEKDEDRPYFELTAFTSNADVNSPDQIWNFSSFYLYRKNEYGAFGGVLNYTNRLGISASQGYVNLLPKLNDGLWFDLGYGYASAPEVFPNNTLAGEIYKKLGKNLIVSGGNTYKKIENTYFNTFTASIAKYVGNYFFSFRPYHYVPKAGPRSTLWRFGGRRYGDNPDQYFGLVFLTGTSPDLFDLLTVNFFKVKNNIFLIEGQQPISDSYAFLYGAGYETQEFPNNFIRRLAYLNIGIKMRIV